MYILGINAYHGDAAAALIKDGQLVAAAEEERFNRVKHCAGFPTQSIQYCLLRAGIDIEQVEHVGISRDPSAHLHKKVLAAATRAVRQTVGGRLQTIGGRLEAEVLALAEEEAGETHIPSNGGGNGKGSGVFRQVRDRLGNAAKVRDLRDELARQMG